MRGQVLESPKKWYSSAPISSSPKLSGLISTPSPYLALLNVALNSSPPLLTNIYTFIYDIGVLHTIDTYITPSQYWLTCHIIQ